MPESEQELDFITEMFKWVIFAAPFPLISFFIRNNTDQLFIGIRDFHKETDAQDIITAMDLSEHIGFTPLTRELEGDGVYCNNSHSYKA